jgi:energy-converting hydrogenase B subunit Q
MENVPDKLKKRYTWMKQHSAREESEGVLLEILAEDRIGLLADITSIISSHEGNLAYFQSWVEYNGVTHILIQIKDDEIKEQILKDISATASVEGVFMRPTYTKTYGKRVIIMGGGAQVAQVASGAIAEADRHNIRGETISVDTMAIIGEREIAQAVRAVGRLHRASLLVLAGALMGGEITRAVQELRSTYGIPVIALKMSGSVPKVADLTVTDPVEAGVMAVMLISHIGQFDLLTIHGKEF